MTDTFDSHSAPATPDFREPAAPGRLEPFGRNQLLKESMDRLYETFDASYLETDPLQFLHQYTTPQDQQVVGLLAAVFAYGSVPQILSNLNRILAPLSPSVHKSILDGSVRDWQERYGGFAYRFQKEEDLTILLWLTQDILAQFGSLEESFLCFYSPRRHKKEAVRHALSQWVPFLRDRIQNCSLFAGLTSPRGIYHLIPDPRSGSACKRWNLFLRWMVRGPDGLDLGLWHFVSPSHLILPLDTHTARIARNLRLTRYRAASWKMAEEVTGKLRILNPEDPIRYDFSIARLGIMARCTKRNPEKNRCRACELRKVCHVSNLS